MSEKMDTSQPTKEPFQHGPQTKRSNFAARRPRGNRGRSSRGKPNDRTNNWRTEQNIQATARYDAMRTARSFDFPTSDDTPAPHSAPTTHSTQEYSSVQFLGMATTSFGRPIPVSTQALGFIVNQYYLKLQHQLGAERVNERCTIHQLYRHSLAQLSYHLYRLRIEQVPRYSYNSEIPNPPVIPPSALEAFKTLELNIGFITSYIQRIGVVMAHDVPHVPMLMMDESPFYVTTFNVFAILHRANRDSDFFRHLLDHNSIPGLRVRGDRILNATDVMPQRYDTEVVFRDASAVRALMNFTSAKMRDVNVFTGRLGQLSDGNAALLLASSASPTGEQDVHIPPSDDGELNPVVGTIDNYWSTVKLTDEQNRLGVLGIYQREDTSVVSFPLGNQWLLPTIAPYRVSADYSAFLNRLIG